MTKPRADKKGSNDVKRRLLQEKAAKDKLAKLKKEEKKKNKSK